MEADGEKQLFLITPSWFPGADGLELNWKTVPNPNSDRGRYGFGWESVGAL